MQRARSVAFGALLGVGFVACSLVTNFDGLSGGQGSDASVAPSVDGSVDASVDAIGAAKDGAPEANPLDGGVESPDGAASQPFCATHDAGFCDDFDDGGLSQWTPSDKQGDTLIEQGQGLSPPNAMLARTTNTTRTEAAKASLSHSLAIGTRLHCELQLRPELVDATADVEALSVEVQSPNATFYHIEFHIKGATLTFNEYGNGPDVVSAFGQTPITPSALHRLVIDLDLTTGSSSFTGKLDDSSPVSHSGLSAPAGATAFVLAIGVYAEDSLAGMMAFSYDNVACDVIP